MIEYTKKLPELLAPAGNPEKLKYAINYGADAVYAGLDDFGMRAAAGNFSLVELDESVRFVHSLNKKIYLTLNTMPHENEIERLKLCLRELRGIELDAFIVADPGVMLCVKEYFPDIPIHLSTQASTVNSYSCSFWNSFGIKRIVLARELSLEDIKKIRDNAPSELELEVFVHGAMCVSYSGRCLLSNFYTGRNANNGKCTQPCRWEYYITEKKRPDLELTALQEESGTFLFSSRDLCMVEHIKELIDSGVNSFKIEGRMKSAYYTAAVTNAYRLAMNDFAEGKEVDGRYMEELLSVSHREYDTGYFFSSPHENANICSKNEYIKEKAFLATVEEYDAATSTALCMQRNKMCLNDEVQLLTPGKFGKNIKITELYDLNKKPIESTPHAKMLFYTKIEGAKPGDILRN